MASISLSWRPLLIFLPIFAAFAAAAFNVRDANSTVNVLIVYAQDPAGQTLQLAQAVQAGALQQNAAVRLVPDEAANYKRDVFDWSDVLILGSWVDNGNAAVSMIQFINSFDFMDDLSGLVGGSFAVAGSAAAGLQPTLEQLNRGLSTFRVVVSGGDDWQSAEGTGVVVNGTSPIANTSDAWRLGFREGARIAKIATELKSGGGGRSDRSGGGGASGDTHTPPGWGDSWQAKVSANLTQVGFDAGEVIVNFTAHCPKDPRQQSMLTVYGDFYTVLTRCDMGREFTIAPASRGGACTVRQIGYDTDKRICDACACPFCVRDTNGTFTTSGEGQTTVTAWNAPTKAVIHGTPVVVYTGRADGARAFDLETAIAYTDAKGGGDLVPVFVNVSHPLWVSTVARIDAFSSEVSIGAFDVPQGCLNYV